MASNYITSYNGASLEVEYYDNSHSITIYVSDPNNLCMDNNYNGDFAGINFNADQVRELHTHLTQILASWEADNTTN